MCPVESGDKEACEYAKVNPIAVCNKCIEDWLDSDIAGEDNECNEDNRLDKVEKKIILELANANMRLAGAMKKIFCSRNVMEKNLRQIEDKTGLNPTDFWDLCELVNMK